MSARREGYIPAAGHDWLLPLYDPVLRLLFRENAAKRQLLEQAEVRSGHRVLDVGCGTGTLAILVKTECPEARVVGLDGDPKALALARRKMTEGGVDVTLDEGLAYQLPYQDASFDRVFSSLVLHHLTRDHKLRTLAEILRVLVPGGTFHLLDFGRPNGGWQRALAHLLFRGAEARDNIEGRLAALVRDAGFVKVEELTRWGTIVGSMWYLRAAKAPGGSGVRQVTRRSGLEALDAGLGHAVVREAGQQLLEGHARLQARQVGAEAGVGSEPEGLVAARSAHPDARSTRPERRRGRARRRA